MTSNVTSFNEDALQIIEDVLTSLGVLRPGGTVSTNDYNFCFNKLNKMLKSWEAIGIHMWKKTEGCLFLNNNQNQYILPNGSGVYCGDNVIDNYLTQNGAGSALTVNSTTGLNVSDNIIVSLDNNTLFSSTIATIPSTTTLTMNGNLSSSASNGAAVYTYTTASIQPITITSARYRTFNAGNNSDRLIFVKNSDEFQQIPTKTDTGTINQFNFIVDEASTTINVWPTPNVTNDTFRFTYIQRIQDFVASTDFPDLPTEWLDCIDTCLQYKVAKAYGRDGKDRALLKADAEEALIQMTLWDADAGSIRIVPNYDWGNE